MRSPAAAPRRRRGRFRPRHVLALGGAGLGLLGLAALGGPAPLIVYNASTSAPVGLYWVRPAGMTQRGDLVLARTPEAVRRLAAGRGYVPATVPLVKRVAALASDTVCAFDHVIAIDGRPVAVQRQDDGRGRPLPAWIGCRVLGDGDVFLLMEDVPDSFDGRYFGVSPAADVIGRLVPLWTG